MDIHGYVKRSRENQCSGTNVEVHEGPYIGFAKFAGSGPIGDEKSRRQDPIVVRGDGKGMGGIWIGEKETKNGYEGSASISEKNSNRQGKNQVGGVKFPKGKLQTERKHVLTLSDNEDR